MKKIIILIFIIIILLSTFSTSYGKNAASSISQLNSSKYTIGTNETASMLEATKKTFTNAKLSYFSDKIGGYTALLSGKIDALIINNYEAEYDLKNDLKGAKLLPGFLDSEIKIVAGLSKMSKIPNLEEKFNGFISRSKTDGTIEGMIKRWVYDKSTEIPDINVPNKTEFHITVGTTGLAIPFSFYAGNKITGFDVELARRFAASIGAELEIKVYDFAGLLMAVATGEVDVALSNLYYIPNPPAKLNFSDTIYTVKPVAVVRSARVPKYSRISELEGKSIGVQTGVDEWAAFVKKLLPSAKVIYYNTFADIIAALKSHKIEAFLADEPLYNLMAAENDYLARVDEEIEDTYYIAYGFPKNEKGKKLCDEMSEYIRKIRESGELETIIAKWEGADAEAKILPDYQNFPAPNGILTMATEGEYPPFNYYSGNKLVGFEIDIAARFCETYGYGLKVTTMIWDAIIPALASEKYDFAGADLEISEEHSEQIYFSEPYTQSRSVMACLRADTSAASRNFDKFSSVPTPALMKSFWDNIMSSFERTFIREERWRLLTEGIFNTMIITILSIIFGMILGFTAFMFCRTGSKIANAFTKFSVWLIKGTPNVVLLMILYYIVFGSINISGLLVSIIAFTLTFGTSFYRMLTLGTGAVDIGQTEAAYALGFTDLQTFFTVILPQAALHFMPLLREEVTMLIKSTSIVGYIAVQDLTKMGDIIRSRTYEAFFPLIAVAVIYFALAGILNIIVTVIYKHLTPSKRKPENILKGISANFS